MSCEHKRLKCVNCEFICADCGAKVEPAAAPTGDEERVTSASGRKIGFEADKPKRRAKKKGAETE